MLVNNHQPFYLPLHVENPGKLRWLRHMSAVPHFLAAYHVLTLTAKLEVWSLSQHNKHDSQAIAVRLSFFTLFTMAGILIAVWVMLIDVLFFWHRVRVPPTSNLDVTN